MFQCAHIGATMGHIMVRISGPGIRGQLGYCVRTDPLMRAALCEIWWLAALNDVEIVVRHKPGAQMDLTDTLSRADVSRLHAEKYKKFAATALEPQHRVTSNMLAPPLPI